MKEYIECPCCQDGTKMKAVTKIIKSDAFVSGTEEIVDRYECLSDECGLILHVEIE